MITITAVAGPNAIVSGLFLDPVALSSSASASASTNPFIGDDTTTEGNWTGTYGTQGYDIINGAVSLPSYAVITPAGATSFTAAASTTVPQALQNPGGTGRIAANWYCADRLHGGCQPDRWPGTRT